MTRNVITMLDSRLPTNMPSHSGIFSGNSAIDSSTTVGYSPTHTAIADLVSDGGVVSWPASKANQLPNELSTVRSSKS